MYKVIIPLFLLSAFFGKKYMDYARLKEEIKREEGERFTAYKDEAGYWTIGVGHKILPHEQHLITTKLTPEQSTELFRRDTQIAVNAVDRLVKVPLTMPQKIALVSFVYNVGVSAFASSTLLRKLNNKDYSGAVAEFPRWNKAGGQVSKILTARRGREASLFNEVA